MKRMQNLVAGACTLLAAHGIEFVTWREWFAPGSSVAPWFLNSGRAVLFTAGCLAIVAAALMSASRATRRHAAVEGLEIAAGAAIAMTIVLFAVGPGTLAPLALVIGWTIAAASAVGGAVAGAALKR